MKRDDFFHNLTYFLGKFDIFVHVVTVHACIYSYYSNLMVITRLYTFHGRLFCTSRPLTSFVVPQGHYQFKRLHLGLSTATKIFSRLMSKFFGGIEDVFIYLDDILIASRSNEEHSKTVETVLLRALDAKITLNLDKSQLASQKPFPRLHPN